MAIKSVGIIGAGTMGNGIAQACAVVGIDAVMLDINEAAVQKGDDQLIVEMGDAPEVAA